MRSDHRWGQVSQRGSSVKDKRPFLPPFPVYLRAYSVTQLSDSATHRLQPARLISMGFPGKNTGVLPSPLLSPGCHYSLILRF